MFFFNETPTTEIYNYYHTLSLHDALPSCQPLSRPGAGAMSEPQADAGASSSPAPAMPAPDRSQKLPRRARTLFVAPTAFGVALPFAIAAVVSGIDRKGVV